MNSRAAVPDDPVVLQMQNDLLAFEVDHLRGRLAAMGSGGPLAHEALQADLVAAREELTRARRHLATERQKVEELAAARSDLRWLLGRLNGTFIGPLLRRYSGFRTLLDRWT